ncbi:hypothetical protein STRAU_2426 [Streptomyces aurantiacus JA 4570]|uniref:Uncharacterized protein n=1 Tax=Streptomyces aurantiacus JA 4570 TaxID=1286094 RepID=S4ASY0_9ACTN|nr:hypothetical protein STRAU_2426 [Streptomyces aurantiacus JA 4570]
MTAHFSSCSRMGAHVTRGQGSRPGPSPSDNIESTREKSLPPARKAVLTCENAPLRALTPGPAEMPKG